MKVNEVAAVVGGLQRGNVVVTFFAGEGRLHFVVANEAIGHGGVDAGCADIVGLFDAVVATGAVVFGVQMRGRLDGEVLFGRDGGAEDGSDVAEFGVELMVEVVDFAGERGAGGAAVGVAAGADRGAGQVVVRGFGAGGGGGVAGCAGEVERQVEPVRKDFLLRTGHVRDQEEGN